MLILSSIFSSLLISSILVAIVDVNIKKFLNTKNIDVNTYNISLLTNFETEGKDKKDYDKHIKNIYIIFIIIFFIASYIILPKI